jgi:glycine hydroxymethyltransferase
MNVFIASDHAGFILKTKLIRDLVERNIRVQDLGADKKESADYPDFATKLAECMSGNLGDFGILICGSGIGVSIAANRYQHMRVALCRSGEDAKMARLHNDANVIAIGSRFTGIDEATRIADIFLSTNFEGGRHQNRIAKLGGNMIEKQSNIRDTLYNLHNTDREVYDAIDKELNRQRNTIELIASENFVSNSVLEAQGSVLTNKYAEGYIGRRYYGGCEYIDVVENLAIERAKKLYGVSYANVQAHSGSQANQSVFLALLNPGDTVLGMSLNSGGHLTHGSKVNLSGKWFNSVFYEVDEQTGLIDLNRIEDIAVNSKPKLIIAGGSAYPRKIDFAGFRQIADKVGAYLMVDMAHFAGLVAGGVFPSPIEHAHVITSTTHKTLRGGRGGIVLTNHEDIYKKINSAIFPGLQGGPLMHVIAAKAVAFGEALKPEFKEYTKKIIESAETISRTLTERGYTIFTGGTDCHLLLVDLRPKGLKGNAAETSLERAGITCNKNSIPFDTEKPTITSGIRVGSAACTSRGFGQAEFKIVSDMVADVLDELLDNKDNNQSIENKVLKEVITLCEKFPIYQ